MSFTSNIKNEISNIEYGESESRAELSAILNISVRLFDDRFEIYTENISVARRIYKLIKETYHVDIDHNKPKFYALVEFPYPSGQGLHVGHPRSYTALDVIARLKRMQGYNVLYPMGFDAFGLPAENYAVKTGVHPAVSTTENIKNFTRQLKSLGFSFDWDRVIKTCDPEYYKWTQWMFLKFFEKGLAYKKKMTINWCPSCKVGLANEEVINGHCERCGHEVVHKEKSQCFHNKDNKV